MITINAKQLKTALSRVMFAADTDTKKYRLNRVLFEFSEDTLVLVAADGFRLSKVTIPLENEAMPGEVLITLDSAKRLYKAIKSKSTVEFTSNANFIVDGIVINTKIVDESYLGYISYNDVAPGYLPARCTVDTKELIQKLKTVFFVSSRQSDDSIIKLEIKGGELRISKAEDEHISIMSADTYGEEALSAFMGRFLLQCLEAIKGGKVSIAFKDNGAKPKRPAEIKIAGDDSFVHWLMPVHIKE